MNWLRQKLRAWLDSFPTPKPPPNPGPPPEYRIELDRDVEALKEIIRWNETVGRTPPHRIAPNDSRWIQ